MNKPIFIMLVGLPGSGKTTYSNKLSKAEFNVHSSDAIRKELYGDENIQGDGNEVFSVLHKRVLDDLKNGRNCVYDATNVHSKRRMGFLNSIKHIECFKKCVVFATPYEECIRRNELRDRKVPEYVINKMYKQWQTPHKFEGWDEVSTVLYDGFNEDTDCDIAKVTYSMIGYDQKNKHHSLTLFEHCLSAREYLESKLGNWNQELQIAAMYHDMGKLKVQTFLDSKGNPTEDAHYYSHENVGAYDSIILFQKYGAEEALYISVLISHHMQPYAWNESKARKKFGNKLVDDLILLHDADLQAH